MIHVEAIWLATEPMELRAGPDSALARVMQVFGEAKPHHAYLFTNKRGNRMKILLHDGHGLWLLPTPQHPWQRDTRGMLRRWQEEQPSTA